MLDRVTKGEKQHDMNKKQGIHLLDHMEGLLKDNGKCSGKLLRA